MRPLDHEVRISRKRRRFLWRTRWSGHDTKIENRRRSRELRCFSINSSTAPSKSSAVTIAFCHKRAYFLNDAAILLSDFARSWTTSADGPVEPPRANTPPRICACYAVLLLRTRHCRSNPAGTAQLLGPGGHREAVLDYFKNHQE